MKKDNFTITFNINPKATPRPRVVKRGAKSIAYYPKKYQDYKDALKELASILNKYYYSGAIGMKINFYMQIPSSLSKKKRSELNGQFHIKKPDCDNLAKGVKDALEGVAYDNDSQIAQLVVEKKYAEKPRIEVEIWELK